MDSLIRVNEAFSQAAKPERFLENPDHCSECEEHEQTLADHTVDSISLAELGNPGWDPICFLQNIDGFRYYLPAMARLACGVGDEYYLDQLLFHLNSERIQQLNHTERSALAHFLEALTQTMPDEIDANLDADPLLEKITFLRSIPGQ